MKGAFRGYFAMPNLGRLRSRVVNPDKDLTSKIREQVMVAIAETLNENALSIKSKVIDFVVTQCGLTFKDKAAENQVAAITGNIFDFYAGSTSQALASLTGETENEDGEEDPDGEGDGEGDPDPEGGKGKGKAKAKKEAEKPEDEDFE